MNHSMPLNLSPLMPYFIIIIIFKFIYFEREREQVLMGGTERERKRDRIPSRLHTVSTDLELGLELMNQEIMT